MTYSPTLFWLKPIDVFMIIGANGLKPNPIDSFE